MIGIVDYGSGNLRSVSNALQHEGAELALCGRRSMDGVRALVLPGVGAFGDCVQNLKKQGLWETLREWLGAGKPFLGICLGYQILFESSEELRGRRDSDSFPAS